MPDCIIRLMPKGYVCLLWVYDIGCLHLFDLSQAIDTQG